MKSKERYQCGICEEMHDNYYIAADCCDRVSYWYECAVCQKTHRREEAADECCAEAKAAIEIDPLSQPATPEERAATGRLF
ncbi:hypothetical protein [Denitromonas halophila]|uniref:Uncharacterized protein n=1 Tax=Denitromonas halophila TaxID=1629404 RepID=A0A557QXB6_9RHOO|nr:hypothetical protein [Denitromonas halophila]TVO57555.1 hypothetical protein FHP91_07715 [Denitromonas halophila]